MFKFNFQESEVTSSSEFVENGPPADLEFPNLSLLTAEEYASAIPCPFKYPPRLLEVGGLLQLLNKYDDVIAEIDVV